MKSSMLRGMSVQSSVRPVISLGGLKHGSQATRQSRSQIVRVANIAAPPAGESPFGESPFKSQVNNRLQILLLISSLIHLEITV